MDQPYLGEIRLVALPFAPKNWAFCNGQLLQINQNQALFSLLGTQFGGNGTTTFALPDLRSRVPVGPGTLPGGGTYAQAQTGGQETVTLTTAQIPAHTHLATGTLQTSDSPDSGDPTGNLPATAGRSQFSNGPGNANMAGVTGTTTATGNGQAHENRPPFLAINYVIALAGVYPSRV